MPLRLHASRCQRKNTPQETQVFKRKLFWQMNELSLDDFAADDHFNSALLSNYGVMWVILSEHVDSCCLLIHSKQTQLGVGRQCTANRDRESGSFTLSPLMSVFFKETLSVTRGSPSLLSLIRSSVSKKRNLKIWVACKLLIHPLSSLHK